jgi:hypothetical protein
MFLLHDSDLFIGIRRATMDGVWGIWGFSVRRLIVGFSILAIVVGIGGALFTPGSLLNKNVPGVLAYKPEVLADRPELPPPGSGESTHLPPPGATEFVNRPIEPASTLGPVDAGNHPISTLGPVDRQQGRSAYMSNLVLQPAESQTKEESAYEKAVGFFTNGTTQERVFTFLAIALCGGVGAVLSFAAVKTAKPNNESSKLVT